MERKIGEIFEYNGEWLQCVEQPEKYDKTVCAICAFQGNGNCELDRCSGTYRSDKKSVIFKKLEKVGEPYEFDGHLFQSYRTFEVPIFTENYATVRQLGNNSKISIEIKQNKEDMEEKYSELTDIVHEYMDKDMTYKDFKEAINDWVDDYVANKESDKPTLKPFDLQQAKDGKPVCTRDGRKARIICFDRVGDFPIVALTDDRDYKEEGVNLYEINGKGSNECFDLMMLPEKKEGWVNVYKRENEYICENECCVFTGIAVFKSEGEAKRNINKNEIYVNTIKISWEE